MTNIAGKWGYSLGGGEAYYGAFDTKEEAIAEAGFMDAFVGQYRAPIMPWECISLDDLFDPVWDHDDYSGEWAEGSLYYTREQKKDLEQRIATVFKAWCEEHDLVPKFGIIIKEIKI